MHSKLIFGSIAAKYWYSDFRDPISGDIDYISHEKIKTREEEHHHFGPSFDWILENNKDSAYVDPNILANLKYAHLGWQGNWWQKTANDVIWFQLKAKERPELAFDPDLYKMFVKDFTALYGRRWAKMQGRDSKTFFQDKVDRKYVHDTIHDAVAYYDRPLYMEILKDSSGSVVCSEEKFNALSERQKLELAKEEIFVTALERWLVPEDFKISPRRAYAAALKKFATTMSAGWMKRYIISHFAELSLNRDFDWIEKFKQGVENGTVKKN